MKTTSPDPASLCSASCLAHLAHEDELSSDFPLMELMPVSHKHLSPKWVVCTHSMNKLPGSQSLQQSIPRLWAGVFCPLRYTLGFRHDEFLTSAHACPGSHLRNFAQAPSPTKSGFHPHLYVINTPILQT